MSALKHHSAKINALLDRLYAMALRGNVPAAALYLDRVLGVVRAPAETGSPHRKESNAGPSSALRTIARPEQEPGKPKRLLSVAEVAELVGVSKSTVYGLKRNGKLRVCRIGRRVLVPSEDLERLINSP
jgi:excisionase family DNA binding protein